jgi:hypothetical protein
MGVSGSKVQLIKDLASDLEVLSDSEIKSIAKLFEVNRDAVRQLITMMKLRCIFQGHRNDWKVLDTMKKMCNDCSPNAISMLDELYHTVPQMRHPAFPVLSQSELWEQLGGLMQTLGIKVTSDVYDRLGGAYDTKAYSRGYDNRRDHYNTDYGAKQYVKYVDDNDDDPIVNRRPQLPSSLPPPAQAPSPSPAPAQAPSPSPAPTPAQDPSPSQDPSPAQAQDPSPAQAQDPSPAQAPSPNFTAKSCGFICNYLEYSTGRMHGVYPINILNASNNSKFTTFEQVVEVFSNQTERGKGNKAEIAKIIGSLTNGYYNNPAIIMGLLTDLIGQLDDNHILFHLYSILHILFDLVVSVEPPVDLSEFGDLLKKFAELRDKTPNFKPDMCDLNLQQIDNLIELNKKGPLNINRVQRIPRLLARENRGTEIFAVLERWIDNLRSAATAKSEFEFYLTDDDTLSLSTDSSDHEPEYDLYSDYDTPEHASSSMGFAPARPIVLDPVSHNQPDTDSPPFVRVKDLLEQRKVFSKNFSNKPEGVRKVDTHYILRLNESKGLNDSEVNVVCMLRVPLGINMSKEQWKEWFKYLLYHSDESTSRRLYLYVVNVLKRLYGIRIANQMKIANDHVNSWDAADWNGWYLNLPISDIDLDPTIMPFDKWMATAVIGYWDDGKNWSDWYKTFIDTPRWMNKLFGGVFTANIAETNKAIGNVMNARYDAKVNGKTFTDWLFQPLDYKFTVTSDWKAWFDSRAEYRQNNELAYIGHGSKFLTFPSSTKSSNPERSELFIKLLQKLIIDAKHPDTLMERLAQRIPYM